MSDVLLPSMPWRTQSSPALARQAATDAAPRGRVGFAFNVDRRADEGVLDPVSGRLLPAHTPRETLEFPHESDVPRGIPIVRDGFVKVWKRVLVVAAVTTSFYTCNFIGDLLRGAYSLQLEGIASLWAAFSALLIELSVPACGYYGARLANKQMVCCFCSCNLFVATMNVVSFVRLLVQTSDLDGNCERETNPNSRETCEMWIRGGVEKYMKFVQHVGVILLGSLAFWFGNRLYQRLTRDDGAWGPPVRHLVGEVILLSVSSIAPITDTSGEGGRPTSEESRPQDQGIGEQSQVSDPASTGTESHPQEGRVSDPASTGTESNIEARQANPAITATESSNEEQPASDRAIIVDIEEGREVSV